MLFASRSPLEIAGRYRWVAAAGLAVALAASSGAALAQPVAPTSGDDCSTLHFNLANPSAGDVLLPGGYVVEGFAFDSAATATHGTGVDRVDFFLNDRDTGGLSLGTADLGQPSTVALPGTPFGNAGFVLELMLPTQSGGQTLFAYAHSNVTDQEQVLSVPIQVGEQADADLTEGMPAPVATTGRATCAAEASPTATDPAMTQPTTPVAPATPLPAVAPTSQPAAVVTPATMAESLHLMLDNPQSGDNLLSGAYSIAGTAFDARATEGSGIERVTLFLGDRDEGGEFLAETTVQSALANGMPLGSFSIVVDLTGRNTGVTLSAYALSSVTGEETVVSIPVTVGDITD